MPTKFTSFLRFIKVKHLSLLSALLIAGAVANLSFAAEEVPFKLTIEGDFIFPDETSAILFGSGICSHGGLTTIDGHVSISPTTVCLSSPGFHASQTNQYEVANGDLIYIDVEEDACFDGDPGIATARGTWEIVGGTGRFDGATGRGIYLGRADFNNNTGVQNLTGTISQLRKK